MWYARVYRAIPTALGVLTLMSAGMLLVSDASADSLSSQAHDRLAALPLLLIALACLAYQAVRRGAPKEWARALLLAFAFVFWAGNQLWPDRRTATLLNDIAIAAFVLDVFLAIVGWPAPAPDALTANETPDGFLDEAGK